MGKTSRLPCNYASFSLLFSSTPPKNKPISIAILGIGGRGACRLATFYKELGMVIYGFDIKKTAVTDELVKKGISIQFSNPTEKLDADLIIYSFNIPKETLKKILRVNKHLPHVEIGELLNKLGTLFTSSDISLHEKYLLKKHRISPLYSIDLENIIKIGVTGTDGKTTTCLLLHHILTKLGYKVGVISTVVAKIGTRTIYTDPKVTTPSSDELAVILKKMKRAKCTHIIIESSSQGLSSERLSGLYFDIVTITNVTSDHIDYHKNVQNYLNIKKKIITEHLKRNGTAILNLDDKRVRSLQFADNEKIHYYSLRSKKSDFFATKISLSTHLNFTYCNRNAKTTHKVTSSLTGSYNIENILGVIGILDSLAINLNKAIPHISTFETVKGRMQLAKTTPYTVLVDFAHTANGLKRSLQAASLYKQKNNNKIIVITGCSGSKDLGKRIPMGRIAHQHADITIIAPINPRFETQENIDRMFSTGWQKEEEKSPGKQLITYYNKDLSLMENRKLSFIKALALMQPGDVLVISGKGHQVDIQERNTSHPWNDFDEIKKLL